MKPLKIAGLVVGALVALLVLAIVAVQVLVDPNVYRAQIEQRVRDATGRPFTIAGSIGLDLFPWLAFDVAGVTLGNPPGYGDAPFLKADRVRVGVKLLPLLGKRLEVRRIGIDGLQVAIVTRADGHSNYEDLTKSDAKQSTSTGPGLTQASIAGVDVNRASISLTDEAKHTVTRIGDLELHTGALGGSGPTKLNLKARIDSGPGTATTQLALETAATLDAARGLATLASPVIEGERTAAAPAAAAAPASAAASKAGAAKPTPFRVTAPALAIDWRAGTLAPTTLDVRYGGLAFGVDVRGEKLFDARVLSGRLTIPEQSPRTLASGVGVMLPATRDPSAFTRLAGSAAFRSTPSSLALEQLDLAFDRSRLRGRAAIDNLETLASSFDLTVDAIDVDGYRAPVAKDAAAKPAATAGAKPPAASPIRLPIELLRSLDVRGQLAIARATIVGLSFSDIRLPVVAERGVLRLTPSSKAFGGTAGGEFRLDASRSPAALTVTQNIRGVDVGAAIKAYTKSERLTGRGNAQATLAATGDTDTALLASLNGPIAVDVADGALLGLDVTYEIQRAQALFSRQSLPARVAGTPVRTPFQALSAQSRLERGVLTSDPIRVETPFLKMNGKGTYRLADQAVDYRLTAVVQEVPPAASGDAAGLANLRSLEIPLAITGTVEDYKVRPQVDALAKARVKQEVEKHKDEIKEKVRDKLRDLLGRPR